MSIGGRVVRAVRESGNKSGSGRMRDRDVYYRALYYAGPDEAADALMEHQSHIPAELLPPGVHESMRSAINENPSAYFRD
jgi:hypothetical protein